ncbi:MAG TPA: M4 family metallopeptidase [Thermoanaerobaculia bacterium]|nr:M4 family metallopeptidase [Thermoanaerobaculia bacterium]
MRKVHHPACSVIPPHIWRHMAEHGDDDVREQVAATELHSQQINAGRAAALMAPAAPTPPIPNGRNRSVYDAGHQRHLPGKLVMADHRAVSSDIEAIEAFDGSGSTFDFYARTFFRNSIDGKGMRIISTIHYGQKFDNAMWDGKQMIYGDGDGKLFNRFTIARDVIGHELTHGVTQYTAALEYHDQSGALNEHISDAFGIMVKQYSLGLTASQSDWLIGKGLLGPNVHGQAIRSMKAPGTAYDDPLLGKDPQPAHMRGYVTGSDDNGGVHINSGILNRAFYLSASALGGFTWVTVGRIWYLVLTERLWPTAGFQDFALATVVKAGELYGIGGQVQMTIAEAWSAVGLPVPPSLMKREGSGQILPFARRRRGESQEEKKAA